MCVSNSTVRVSDVRLAFDRRCCTKHSMYLFQSWISGIIWFQSMISLVVHVCFFMQCSSALQGSSRVSQLREKGGLLPLIFPPPAGLLSVKKSVVISSKKKKTKFQTAECGCRRCGRLGLLLSFSRKHKKNTRCCPWKSWAA